MHGEDNGLHGGGSVDVVDEGLSPVLTGVAPYGSANSTVRARLLNWVDYLQLAPVELVLGTRDPLGLAAQRRSLHHHDAPLLLLRNAAKLSRGRVESRLLRGASVGVYDIDDGLPWDNGRLPGLGAWWKRPWPRSLIAARAAKAADRVIAGNQLLADWASTLCPDVVVIPTCVDPSAYQTKNSYELSDPPRLGWLGSPATEGYLQDIAASLAEVHRRTGARLTLVSSDGSTHPALAPFTDRVRWTPEVQHTFPATWDVGLMPVRDGVYERAKCAYKLLQYGAAGLPCIGSPVGMSATVLEQFGAPGPRSSRDWVDALMGLIQSGAQHRGALGHRARRTVQADYSYATWATRWSSALN